MSAHRLGASLACVALVACKAEPAPDAPKASASAVTTLRAAAASVAAPPKLPPRTPADTGGLPAPLVDGGVVYPKLCEVEISGNLKVPRALDKGVAPQTFVSTGDCLAGGKVVGNGGSTNGRFFVEVFVPWGSDLTLCAAVVPEPGKPSTVYGKAKVPMHAEKSGEVEFEDVVVELASGPPKVFQRP